MREIETLIRHRDPFLFVDEIISATETEIIGVKTFSKEFLNKHLYDFEHVPGMIIVEMMAQCGGAGVKKVGAIEDGLFGFTKIEKAKFIKPAKSDKQIKVVIQNIKVSNLIIKQSGVAYINEEPVVEATWLCMRI
jgi:3-hydroxyacyl-[acyl-carrier-protein] dehydratase